MRCASTSDTEAIQLSEEQKIKIIQNENYEESLTKADKMRALGLPLPPGALSPPSDDGFVGPKLPQPKDPDPEEEKRKEAERIKAERDAANRKKKQEQERKRKEAERKKKQKEKQKPRGKKVKKQLPLESTYSGTHKQNDLYVYVRMPKWRPPKAGGSKNKSYFGELPKQPVPFAVRKKFWDSTIEPPQPYGQTKLQK